MAAYSGERWPDPWIGAYEACERSSQLIMEMVNKRDDLQRKGSNSGKANSEIRVKLRTFSQDLGKLQSSLQKEASSKKLLSREVERRHALIEGLKARETIISDSFKKDATYTSPDRERLLPSDNTAFEESVWGQNYRQGVDHSGSYQTIREQQQQIIAEQDEGLETLADIISRQKEMGKTISEELDEHNGGCSNILPPMTSYLTDTHLITPGWREAIEIKHLAQGTQRYELDRNRTRDPWTTSPIP
ncbi:putative syntaxin-8 [Apostichopus japonicus]|uniref:Putative syntaxin-8 n=1 Tax=Stichopus japonicus TaxID=307972 RepID=A0A2G8K5N9_STIJA|nr:putative syntaxin-8 [Apostichopus japonicus]